MILFVLGWSHGTRKHSQLITSNEELQIAHTGHLPPCWQSTKKWSDHVALTNYGWTKSLTKLENCLCFAVMIGSKICDACYHRLNKENARQLDSSLFTAIWRWAVCSKPASSGCSKVYPTWETPVVYKGFHWPFRPCGRKAGIACGPLGSDEASWTWDAASIRSQLVLWAHWPCELHVSLQLVPLLSSRRCRCQIQGPRLLLRPNLAAAVRLAPKSHRPLRLKGLQFWHLPSSFPIWLHSGRRILVVCAPACCSALSRDLQVNPWNRSEQTSCGPCGHPRFPCQVWKHQISPGN